MCKKDLLKIIKPAQGFINRMLQTLRAMPDHRPVPVTEDFSKDLTWFQSFVQVFNGCTLFVNWQGESDFYVYVV